MSELVLTADELKNVKDNLWKYDWYHQIYQGFYHRVEELIDKKPAIPVKKSMVFYESCPEDNTRLNFDPYQPHQHVCPHCGKNWTGDKYYRAWLRQFHEWLAKRMIEAGILYRVSGKEKYADCVVRVLKHYCNHYEEYPLTNNLLGPTRLFQSTYIESFWLTDMVIAYNLVRKSPVIKQQYHLAIKDLFYKSSNIIKSYNEGKSNRQAFNNVALGAVGLLYNDQELIDYVLHGPAGFAFHMQESVLADGLWYEGENYHFATLDHLLYLAEMARHQGLDLYKGSSGCGSLKPMFNGPLKVMYPDLTFPSRKDSWFGRGIDYHKEIYELGYARYGDKRYGGLLSQAYNDTLTREDLSWRSFLYCKPELPQISKNKLRPDQSHAMKGTGVSVLRREQGSVYASVEYGHYGGGHGHPDRLHLNLYDQNRLWFLNPGTGWYHVPELAWYRSTLAHNTVVVDGVSQEVSEGELTAFGTTDKFQVTQAFINNVYPGVDMRRTLCLGQHYLFDVFDIYSEQEHIYDNVLHTEAQVNVAGHIEEMNIGDKLGSRNGYQFLDNVVSYKPEINQITLVKDEAQLSIWQPGSDNFYTAQCPGIPLKEETCTALIRRRKAVTTRFITCYFRQSAPENVDIKELNSRFFLIELEEERHFIQIDVKEDGVVIITDDNSDHTIDWFNKEHIEMPGLKIDSDYPLKQASINKDNEHWYFDIPQGFGKIKIHNQGHKLTETIIKDAEDTEQQFFCMPAGVTLEQEDNKLIISQIEETLIQSHDNKQELTFYAGCNNRFQFKIGDYDGTTSKEKSKSPEPSLILPSGWNLVSLHKEKQNKNIDIWQAVIDLPLSEEIKQTVKKRNLTVKYGETDRKFEINVVAPLAVEWDLIEESQKTALALNIKEQRHLSGMVAGKIMVPWLDDFYDFECELAAGAQEQVTIPVPLSPVKVSKCNADKQLIIAEKDLWPLSARDNPAGDYCFSAVLQLEGFQGYSSINMPLYWSKQYLPENDLADICETEMIYLNKAEQAYWKEVPYQGQGDCSAKACISRDNKGIYLQCKVRDDIHITDGNEEDLFENDSLQIYFDFRDQNHRQQNFTPGVAAYILAPDQEKTDVLVKTIAGNKEISNRESGVDWFNTEGVETEICPAHDGYQIRVFFPYTSLGVEPLQSGDIIGFDFALSDNDGTWYRKLQLMWSGSRGRRGYLRGSYHDPRLFGHLIVAD